ncbi:MAG TPA: tetratricopeptide repeat protein [Verrucomicrobiae bacterium]|jgi:hypothetical protein|nr:tetratricopeptide repeat protein [Verrucomicrobiae bacterium]
MKINHSYWPRGATTFFLAFFTLTILDAALPALADSPSDLLEQGIYSEETKGDIDAAVLLYQKVIAQAKEDQAVAAQAQYHLGACYYKKQDYTNANAAFEEVVKDYPDQTNLVARARKYLAGANTVLLQPAPWTDGEVMRLDVNLAGGLKVGFVEYTVNAGETNGQNVWKFASHMEAAGNQSVSHVVVDAATLNPLSSVWKHTLLGEVFAVYYPDHVELVTTGKDETNKLEFEGSVIDNEEAVEWMRCVPFADGYKNSQQVLTTLGDHVVTTKYEVTGPEQVQVPAGTYEAYKVVLNIGQTFWYSSDPKHYLVKFEAGGAVAELTGVTGRTPGERTSYTDPTFGFSLSAPPGWLFDKDDSGKVDRAGVNIIDPQGLATSSLLVMRKSSLNDQETNSVRKAMEAGAVEQAKMFKDFKIRPDSWKEFTLAGNPAASVVCDYTDGKTPAVSYHTWGFDSSNSVHFDVYVHASDFDAFHPKIDAVINSYQTK